MNTRNDTGFRTFLVGTGGVTRHTRVKLDTGTIVTAGAGEDSIGIVLSTEAAGAYAPVKLWSAPGTFCATSAGAITSGAAIYGAANGQIDDAVSGNKIGTALEAATGANQDIEFLPADVGTLFAVQTKINDPAAPSARTSNTITDGSTGTASTSAIAEITNAANAGSADIAPTKNAIATLAAELVLAKADLEALRTGIANNNTAIDSILDALEANGITAAA